MLGKFGLSIAIGTSFLFSQTFYAREFDIKDGIRAKFEVSKDGNLYIGLNGKRSRVSTLKKETLNEFDKESLLLVEDFNGDGYKDFAIPSKDAVAVVVNSYKDYYLFRPESGRFVLAGKGINYLQKKGKKLVSYTKDGVFTYEEYYIIKAWRLYKIKSVVDFGIVKKTLLYQGEMVKILFTPNYLYIKSSKAYFYDKPDKKSRSKVYIIRGDKVKILDIKPLYGWLKVEYPSKKKVFRKWIRLESVE